MYAPYQDRDGNWHTELVKKYNNPCLQDELKPQKTEGGVNSFINGFEIPLSELMAENSVEAIKDRITTMRDVLIKAATKESNKQLANA
ncbi:MAG: hypothetical protein RPR97_05485 [Colwellia sp.]